MAGLYAASPFGPPTAGDMATISFVVTATTTIDVVSGGFDGSDAVVGDGDDYGVATITVIPEPMTMALLGLGGLFLRRRK